MAGKIKMSPLTIDAAGFAQYLVSLRDSRMPEETAAARRSFTDAEFC
jgi:hypothetical protein